jgi:hypothetical protein
LAFLLTVVIGAAPAWSKAVEFTFNDVVVSIDVPPDMEVQNRTSPPLDFLLYDVIRQGTTLIGIYIGNAPQKPDVPKEKFRKGLIAGCETYSLDRPKNGGLGRDTFVLLNPPSGAPQVVHFFYGGLTAAQARQADAVVMSLKPVRGDGCSR